MNSKNKIEILIVDLNELLNDSYLSKKIKEKRFEFITENTKENLELSLIYKEFEKPDYYIIRKQINKIHNLEEFYNQFYKELLRLLLFCKSNDKIISIPDLIRKGNDFN